MTRASTAGGGWSDGAAGALAAPSAMKRWADSAPKPAGPSALATDRSSASSCSRRVTVRRQTISPTRITGRLSRAAQAPVDLGDLFDPPAPVRVLHREHVLHGPVEVVGDVGYLLVEAVEGVAYDSPRPARSASNLWPQEGQVAGMPVVPFSLICR